MKIWSNLLVPERKKVIYTTFSNDSSRVDTGHYYSESSPTQSWVAGPSWKLFSIAYDVNNPKTNKNNFIIVIFVQIIIVYVFSCPEQL